MSLLKLWHKVSYNIPILFQNADIVVFDKPEGLIVNLSQTSGKYTLQSYLQESYPELYENTGHEEFENRCGIVHRLDKATSGVILCAKNPESFEYLKHQFKSREVYKEYYAVIYGTFKDDMIDIAVPIERSRRNRTKFTISETGRDAYTRVEIIDRQKFGEIPISSVRCLPRTGRTHQIRVHMAAMNTSILGDPLYAGKKQLKFAHEHNVNRMLLHARKLGIRIDTSSDEMTYFESEIPKDFIVK